MPLTKFVGQAIDGISHRFQGPRGDEALAQLGSHRFADQLLAANVCLDCFLSLELDPAAATPVGGEGKLALGAALHPNGNQAEALRDAVGVTMTESYLTMMGLEDPAGSDYVARQSAEQLWRFWIDHMRGTATLAFGLPGEFVGAVRREGGKHLEAEIKRLGLMPRLARRRRITDRCGSIAVFGLLLRVGQTNGCDGETFEASQSTDKIREWPFCTDN